MRQWEQLRQTLDVDAVEMLTDFLHAGDRVAVRVCWHGAGSGPEANLEMTDVFTVRKGKIFYLEFSQHSKLAIWIGSRRSVSAGCSASRRTPPSS
jgi:hypothetical protein